jgi:hypothetical protein
VFVAAPQGVSDLSLAVPLALTPSFSLSEPEAFRHVAKAARALEQTDPSRASLTR